MGKYKKLPIKGYKNLDMYPVYVDNITNGIEPFRIVGIRKHSVELVSGLDNSSQPFWIEDERVFIINICSEQLKPGGCQYHNVHCCGGGSIIIDHVDYWNNLVD